MIEYAARLPPHSLESEQGLLCSLLIAPDLVDSMGEQVAPEMFYFPAHRSIYAAMRKLRDESKPIDLIPIFEALKDAGQFESVGGPAAVSTLYNIVPTAANAMHYLERVRDAWRLRRIITATTELASSAYEHGAEADEVESKLSDLAVQVALQTAGARRTRRIGEVLVEAVDAIQARYEAKLRGNPVGIPSGLPLLDRMMCGWRPGQMIVISARPKEGKSSAARQFALHAVMVAREPTFYATLEMTNAEIGEALISTHGRVESTHLRTGELTKLDMEKITQTSAAIHSAPLFVRDESEMEVGEFAAALRVAVLKDGVRLGVLDYAQLLIKGQNRFQKRNEEAAAISRKLKVTAKSLGIPLLVLSQVNEDGETADSKGFERDADAVLRIDHEDIENPENGKAWINIRFQRNGPTGGVPVLWRPEYTVFLPRAIDPQEKAPAKHAKRGRNGKGER